MNEDNGSNSPRQNEVESDASAANEKTAIWLPAWHELDQTLVVGMRQRCYFFQQTPDHYIETLSKLPNVDYVFFNGVDETVNSQMRMTKIVRMNHAQLGDLLRIDTLGLDYIVYPMDGEEIVIDAEEEPGVIRSGTSVSIDDWTVRVFLQEVSEPIEQDVC